MRTLRTAIMGGLAALALSGCGRPEAKERTDYTGRDAVTYLHRLQDVDRNGTVDFVKYRDDDVEIWVSQEYSEKGYKAPRGIMPKELQTAANDLLRASNEFEFQVNRNYEASKSRSEKRVNAK